MTHSFYINCKASFTYYDTQNSDFLEINFKNKKNYKFVFNFDLEGGCRAPKDPLATDPVVNAVFKSIDFQAKFLIDSDE